MSAPASDSRFESVEEKLKRVGHWWSRRWWEDEPYQVKLPLTEIRARVDCLATVFDEEWLKKALQAGPPNAILARLAGSSGMLPFQWMMSLGRTIRAVASAEGFERKRTDFIGQKSHATLFECDVAALLIDDGWGVRFPASGTSPTPDIVAHKAGRTIAVECKLLQREHWEKWASNLGFQVLTAPGTRAASDRSVEIAFDQRLTELLTGDSAASQGLLEEIVSRVDAMLADIERSGDIPAIREIPEVVSVSVSKREGNNSGGAGGIAISAHAKTRRVIQRVLDATAQIAPFETGVVAVLSDYVPSPELFDVAINAQLRGNAEKLANLALVLVVPHGSDFDYMAPLIWRHPNPQKGEVATAALDSLTRQLRLHENFLARAVSR